MQVNPADIRFTQDSISLYFQYPYDHFDVREAVRKISRNEMTPDHFPFIRVNSYGGCLWSVDNRRLWVFRLARLPNIAVKLVKKIHPRLKGVISNPDLHSMMQVEYYFPRVRDRGQEDCDFDRLFPQPVPSLQVEDFFPRVRDRGQEDREFDRLFPQPVPSLQQPVNEFLEEPPINMAQVSNVDTEKSGTSTMPPEPSINHVQDNAEDEHQYGHIHIDIVEESGTTPPPKQSIDPMRDHAKDEHQSETAHMWNVFAIARKISNVGRMTRDVVGGFFWNIFSVARKIAAAVARKIANFGRMTKNSVGSFFWNIFSVARKTAAAVARKIAS